MARTSKTQTGKTQHDTSTKAGFVAAYDAEVDRLNTAKQWCSAGRSYPYSQTVVDGKQVIQAPRDRAPEMQPGLTDDDLTDSGKAKLAAAQGADLDTVRKGAYACLEWAVQGDYITADDMTEVCAALGLAPLTQVTTRGGYMSADNAFYFTRDADLSADERAAVIADASDAVRAVMTAHGLTADDTYHAGLMYFRSTTTTAWKAPAA